MSPRALVRLRLQAAHCSRLPADCRVQGRGSSSQSPSPASYRQTRGVAPVAWASLIAPTAAARIEVPSRVRSRTEYRPGCAAGSHGRGHDQSSSYPSAHDCFPPCDLLSPRDENEDGHEGGEVQEAEGVGNRKAPDPRKTATTDADERKSVEYELSEQCRGEQRG